MAIITKITRQKNNPERYNIYIEEKYAFAVDESLLVKYQLSKDKDLEDFERDEIVFDDEVRKAFNKALDFLSFRMRSEHEVKKKLLDAEYGEAVVLEAIQKLYHLGFLNDESFSKALLETQKKTSQKGPRAIQQELKKKESKNRYKRKCSKRILKMTKLKLHKDWLKKLPINNHLKPQDK